MELNLVTFLIVCPLVGLAGFVDAIGGGGGLISLPAYMLAGVPAHNAIATNKLSSTCGTALATGRFIKNGLVNFILAIPAVISAIIGSFIGANLSMRISERVLSIVLLVILPIVAFVVLNKKYLLLLLLFLLYISMRYLNFLDAFCIIILYNF